MVIGGASAPYDWPAAGGGQTPSGWLTRQAVRPRPRQPLLPPPANPPPSAWKFQRLRGDFFPQKSLKYPSQRRLQ
jgi:hypothetical protein